MRHLFRLVWIATTGTAAMLCAALLLVPASEAERAVLPSDDQLAVVELRLIRTLMTIAPDQTVRLLADRSGLPDDVVRVALLARASGDALAPDAPRNRQTRAGGALFVTPD